MQFSSKDEFPEQLPPKNELFEQLPSKDDLRLQLSSKDELPISLSFKDEVHLQLSSKDDVHIQLSSKDKRPIQLSSKDELPIQLSSKDEPPIQLSSKDELPIQLSSKDELPIQLSYKDEIPVQLSYKDELPVQLSSKSEPPVQHTLKDELPKRHSSEDELPKRHSSEDELFKRHCSGDGLNQQHFSEDELPMRFSSIGELPKQIPLKSEVTKHLASKYKVSKYKLPGGSSSKDKLPGRLSSKDKLLGRLSSKDKLPGQLSSKDKLPGQSSVKYDLQGQYSSKRAVLRQLPSKGKLPEQLSSKAAPSEQFPSKDEHTKQLRSKDERSKRLPSKDEKSKRLPYVNEQSKQLSSKDEKSKQLPSVNEQSKQLPSLNEQSKHQPFKEEPSRQLISKEEPSRQLPSKDELYFERFASKEKLSERLLSKDPLAESLSSKDELYEGPPSKQVLSEQLPSKNSISELLPSEDELSGLLLSKNEFSKQLTSKDNLSEQRTSKNEFLEQYSLKDELPKLLYSKDKLAQQLFLKDELVEQLSLKDELAKQLSLKVDLAEQLSIKDKPTKQLSSKDELPKQLSSKDDPLKQLCFKDKLPKQLSSKDELLEIDTSNFKMCESFTSKVKLSKKKSPEYELSSKTSLKEKLIDESSSQVKLCCIPSSKDELLSSLSPKNSSKYGKFEKCHRHCSNELDTPYKTQDHIKNMKISMVDVLSVIGCKNLPVVVNAGEKQYHLKPIETDEYSEDGEKSVKMIVHTGHSDGPSIVASFDDKVEVKNINEDGYPLINDSYSCSPPFPDSKLDETEHSMGSPGTPLMDEQPYSPCLILPEFCSSDKYISNYDTKTTKSSSKNQVIWKNINSCATEGSLSKLNSNINMFVNNEHIEDKNFLERSYTPPLPINSSLNEQPDILLFNTIEKATGVLPEASDLVSTEITDQVNENIDSKDNLKDLVSCTQQTGYFPKLLEHTELEENASSLEVKFSSRKCVVSDQDLINTSYTDAVNEPPKICRRSERRSSNQKSQKDKLDHNIQGNGFDLKTEREKMCKESTSFHKHGSIHDKNRERKDRSHSSSSDSKHYCSKCYRRSKVRRASIGVQCRRDKTIQKYLNGSVSDVRMCLNGPKLDFQSKHYVLPRPLPYSQSGLEQLKYSRFIRIETYPNGGASIVHMYQDEIDVLSKEEMEELAVEFFKVVFGEDERGYAHHVMGIVHDAASYLPDLLDHMADHYPSLTVKNSVLGRNNDIETTTMAQYRNQRCNADLKNTLANRNKTMICSSLWYGNDTHENTSPEKFILMKYVPVTYCDVEKTLSTYKHILSDKRQSMTTERIEIHTKVQVSKHYSNGTVRYGPLHQISLVGTVHEETMPWGPLSVVQMATPQESNDGPILWIRPGEQLVPTADNPKLPARRRRTGINELRNLQYLPRLSEAREYMFEDRTKAHADHTKPGIDVEHLITLLSDRPVIWDKTLEEHKSRTIATEDKGKLLKDRPNEGENEEIVEVIAKRQIEMREGQIVQLEKENSRLRNELKEMNKTLKLLLAYAAVASTQKTSQTKGRIPPAAEQ
uniref:Uncharacterized protein n=1 Tax=Timema poppense TaxID=170557 RepID=A0A7R9CP64_TIMPO|nr:unnamed protein product [Timema poppensis]